MLIPSHWSTRFGGAELQVRAFVERLAAGGAADVHVLARNLAPAARVEGYALHAIAPRPRLAGSLALDAPGLLAQLEALAPDVVYQRVACAYTGVAAHYARTHRRRFVWHVSSDNDLEPRPRPLSWRTPLQALDRRAIRHGARQASTVVVQTRAQAVALERHHGRADAVRVPNFHASPAERVAKATDRLRVAWIGNLKPLKRPELFLRLAQAFRDRPEVEFVLAGAVQMQPREWASLRAAHPGIANLRELGPLTPEGARAVIADSHVLVNTSLYEGYPNTFIEAWLRDTAVLSLAVDPDGVFADGRCGLCAGGDFGRLRDSLARLADDPALRARLAQGGRVHALAQHSVANVDRLVDVVLGG